MVKDPTFIQSFLILMDFFLAQPIQVEFTVFFCIYTLSGRSHIGDTMHHFKGNMI